MQLWEIPRAHIPSLHDAILVLCELQFGDRLHELRLAACLLGIRWIPQQKVQAGVAATSGADPPGAAKMQIDCGFDTISFTILLMDPSSPL
jgi:hypothetical protein